MLEDIAVLTGGQVISEDLGIMLGNVTLDRIQAGVIDPAGIVRTALQDAASVAGSLITTEAAVADAPGKGSAGGAGGGMGGMDF